MSDSPGLPLGFFSINGFEWIIIGTVALLVFGRRLPDVARSMGRSIVEFKKGLRDVEGEIDQAGGAGGGPPGAAPSGTEPKKLPPASPPPAGTT